MFRKLPICDASFYQHCCLQILRNTFCTYFFPVNKSRKKVLPIQGIKYRLAFDATYCYIATKFSMENFVENFVEKIVYTCLGGVVLRAYSLPFNMIDRFSYGFEII